MNLEKLKKIRKNKGYTIQKISTKLDMTISTYSDKEKGKKDFKIEELEAIFNVLGLNKEEALELLDLKYFKLKGR